MLTIARRSSAEIDELFERKIPAWKWKSTVTEVETQLATATAAGIVEPKFSTLPNVTGAVPN